LRNALISIAQQAARDLELLAVRGPEIAIHALRVRMKKLHALLLLVDPCVADGTMKAIKRCIGTLKQAFATSRDQTVIDDLLAKLVEQNPNRGKRSVSLKKSSKPEVLPKRKQIIEMVRTADALIYYFQKLKLHDLTWEEVRDAYASNYAEARRHYKRCRKKPTARRMHRWRKPVKSHYFQSLFLLRDQAQCSCASQLGSMLGKTHDFHLLQEQLPAEDSENLANMIKHRIKDIRSLAFQKARRLFGHSPKKFRCQDFAGESKN
jgi:hypothetical protein